MKLVKFCLIVLSISCVISLVRTTNGATLETPSVANNAPIRPSVRRIQPSLHQPRINSDDIQIQGSSGLKSASVSKTVNDLPKAKKSQVRGSKTRRDPTNCFTDCLAESVPPDVVLECISSCGTKQYVNCALCIGVGVYVVYQCASNCYGELQ
jgi:hypothetical protein